MASISKTIQTELVSLVSIGPKTNQSQIESAVQAVTTNLAATIYIDHAWVVTSNPSVGTEYIIEASQQASNDDTWVPITTFQASNMAASLASTVAANNTAGATIIAVTVANPGWQAGDRIYFAGPTISLNEFNRIAWVSGVTVGLFDGLKNTQNSVPVVNRVERYIATIDTTAITRLRVVINNAGQSDIGQTIAACNSRVACITADSIA